MRNTLFLLMIVVMSVALAAAQHNPSMPSNDQSNSSPGGRATSPSPDAQNGPSTAPGMPSGQATSPAAPAAGDSKVVEGCLGGSAPNFTVTDQAGTKYNLDIPKDADTAPLTAHLGQAVKVKGVVSGEKASATASPKIQVEQMARGTMTCPAGANSPSSTNPPSSK